jgi:ABC-type Na+ efflux pump permease subunit
MWSAVFYLEFLRAGRRLRLHAVRWLFAAWLLVILLLNWGGRRLLFFPFMLFTPQGETAPPGDLLVLQLFGLLLLAVPPFTAGAITEEKALGTLSELLMSGLTPWRIVFGKLVSRVGHVGLVVIAGVPLLCWFGGLDLIPLLAVVVATAGVLCSLAAVSLLASVLFRTTSSAVLGAYAASALAFVAVRFIGGPLACLDPLYLLEPALASRDLESLRDRLLLSGLGWTAVTAGCVALAAWQLRPAYVRQFFDGRNPMARRRASAHPRVGDDPLRWKERYVGGILPLPLLGLLPRWVGVVLVAVASAVVSGYTFSLFLPPEAKPGYLLDKVRSADYTALEQVLERTSSPGIGFLVQGLLVMLLTAALVNLRGAGGISGEREKGTWDALLLAGLGPRWMVRGKLLGMIESTYPFLIAYAVPALLLGALGGVASFLAVLGTGAMLWPAMYLSSAVALERSTRYANPWKAATDSLIVTSLLVAGLVYTPVSFLFPAGLVLNMVGGSSGGVPWGMVVTMLALGGFLGWLMTRVARDYIKLSALAIKEGKGDLPDKKWLPDFSAKRPDNKRPAKRRRPADDEDDEDELPVARRRRKGNEGQGPHSKPSEGVGKDSPSSEATGDKG